MPQYAKNTWQSWPHTLKCLAEAGHPTFLKVLLRHSHPEEIPRKKSKAQDLAKLAPYYLRALVDMDLESVVKHFIPS